MRYNTIFQNPNRLLWLIFACLLLLGVSQVLWVNRVWHEQQDVLHQETNYIFQNTVLALQDSLVRRSMTKNGIPVAGRMPFPPPIWGHKMWEGATPEIRQEFKTRLNKTFQGDVMPEEKLESNQIKVIISRNDTQSEPLQHGLSRFLFNVRQDSAAAKSENIVFEVHADTISASELYHRYAMALDSAALPGTFTLLLQTDPESFADLQTMATEPAMTGFMKPHFFQAVFQDYKGYLARKILPYALFSLFLFSLTSLAFWLIFNTTRQQQKLAQQKNEFISNVTHELKTPLTTVGVALEALRDFDVMRNPEKTEEYLNISKLELERLNLLVDKVLRLSMFEQQALQLRPELLDLATTTQQVIHAMTLQAESTGAVIHFHTDSHPCLVFCDRLHLTGVVYNLLDNALKYRRERPEIAVEIEKNLREGRVFFSLKVSDNGIGIAQEYQAQIFEKFFRVPTGNTHNVKGHGLGLSYVAHVAREHGGSIQLHSVPGKGSAFTVEIPAAAPPPTA